MEDNINSHFYYHLISMVQEWRKIINNDRYFDNYEMEISEGISMILKNVRYKNKSYNQILIECKLDKE